MPLFEHAMALYASIKAHENGIMPMRPDKTPRAAWRMENPGPSPYFRVVQTADGKSRQARINADTKAVLEIYSTGERPKLLDRIDLTTSAGIDKYALPSSNDMTGDELKAAREALGLSQKQLAPLLDLSNPIRVSEYETGRRSVPTHIARIMHAYESGWRPSDWSK